MYSIAAYTLVLISLLIAIPAAISLLGVAVGGWREDELTRTFMAVAEDEEALSHFEGAAPGSRLEWLTRELFQEVKALEQLILSDLEAMNDGKAKDIIIENPHNELVHAPVKDRTNIWRYRDLVTVTPSLESLDRWVGNIEGVVESPAWGNRIEYHPIRGFPDGWGPYPAKGPLKRPDQRDRTSFYPSREEEDLPEVCQRLDEYRSIREDNFHTRVDLRAEVDEVKESLERKLYSIADRLFSEGGNLFSLPTTWGQVAIHTARFAMPIVLMSGFPYISGSLLGVSISAAAVGGVSVIGKNNQRTLNRWAKAKGLKKRMDRIHSALEEVFEPIHPLEGEASETSEKDVQERTRDPDKSPFGHFGDVPDSDQS